MTDTYAQPRYDGPADLMDAIERDDVDHLGELIIGAALYDAKQIDHPPHTRALSTG